VSDHSNIGLPPAYTDGPSEAARQRGEWAMAALDYSAAYLVLRPYALMNQPERAERARMSAGVA
jgi:hypothetical protein